jgi:thiamine biosynthesis lipoprotein ApbE
MKVDGDTRGVSAAARARRSTGGAFNIAVEPLMRVWGFRDRGKLRRRDGNREAEKAVRASVM